MSPFAAACRSPAAWYLACSTLFRVSTLPPQSTVAVQQPLVEAPGPVRQLGNLYLRPWRHAVGPVIEQPVVQHA